MKIKITKQVEEKTEVNLELPYYGKIVKNYSTEYHAILNQNLSITAIDYKSGIMLTNSTIDQSSKDWNNIIEITKDEFTEAYNKAQEVLRGGLI